MNLTFKFIYKKVLFFFLLLSFYSCGLFLSPYSPHSYSNLTQLKVLHLKFIETFTKGNEDIFKKEKIDEFANTIDIKFREAIEFEKQITNDETRLRAFEILYEEFNSNYSFILESGELFNIPFSEELTSEIEKNYDLAIKGELSRRDSPIN